MRIWQLAAAMAGLLLAVADAYAGSFEQPPVFNAAKVLGSAASGTNYSIVDPVPSDGYLRNYTLKTPDGTFKVNGDQLLFMRFKELAALDALNKTAGSKRFAEAVVKAGLSPVEFVGSLVTKPVGTVKNTVSGVGQFFDGLASGVRNTGKTQDGAFASITGEAKEKRLLAYQIWGRSLHRFQAAGRQAGQPGQGLGTGRIGRERCLHCGAGSGRSHRVECVDGELAQ